MPKVIEMQGVPAHLEYLKSDGHRRHPAHCIFAEGKGNYRICSAPQSSIYRQNCKSSKNCDYYEEKESV